MELAITPDAMTPLSEPPTILKAYQEISTLHSVTATQNYPNVLAIAKSESAGSEQLVIRYAKTVLDQHMNTSSLISKMD